MITFRTDQTKAEQDIARFGIQCDGVVLVRSFAEKATVIAEKVISVHFDDQDEILLRVPEGVTVLKIRNGGAITTTRRGGGCMLGRRRS